MEVPSWLTSKCRGEKQKQCRRQTCAVGQSSFSRESAGFWKNDCMQIETKWYEEIVGRARRGESGPASVQIGKVVGNINCTFRSPKMSLSYHHTSRSICMGWCLIASA